MLGDLLSTPASLPPSGRSTRRSGLVSESTAGCFLESGRATFGAISMKTPATKKTITSRAKTKMDDLEAKNDSYFFSMLVKNDERGLQWDSWDCLGLFTVLGA